MSQSVSLPSLFPVTFASASTSKPITILSMRHGQDVVETYVIKYTIPWHDSSNSILRVEYAGSMQRAWERFASQFALCL